MNTIVANTTGKGDGQENLVRHLSSDAFFDVENHPTSTLLLKEVVADEALGFAKLMAKADLTIKGITNEVEFPVSVIMEGEDFKVYGNVKFDRSLCDIPIWFRKILH